MAAAAPLIDELMPRFDEFERHAIPVPAPPAVVYAALRRVDLLGSRLIRWLILLRSVPAALSRPRPRRPRGALTLDRMLEGGFVLLGERPERELALGVVGRFWTPGGERVTLDADGFRAFDRPGALRQGRVGLPRGAGRTGGHPALDGDAHLVRGRRQPPQLPALLAGGEAVQRAHPHSPAAGRDARGYSMSGTFALA